jgi:protein-disulfide isomerase
MKLINFLCILLFSFTLASCSPLQSKVSSEQTQDIQAVQRLINDTNPSEIKGNQKGSVTLVEFFDYRCHYCHQQEKTLKRLMKVDPRIRLIYREVSFLGATSDQLARFATAAKLQGKYLALHDALMGQPSVVSFVRAQRLAKKMGFDMKKLTQDMQALNTKIGIAASESILNQFGVNGIPAFVVIYKPTSKASRRYLVIEGSASLDQLESGILKLVMAKS